jgi:hypothetical protein
MRLLCDNDASSCSSESTFSISTASSKRLWKKQGDRSAANLLAIETLFWSRCRSENASDKRRERELDAVPSSGLTRLILLPLPASRDCMVDEMERLEVGGGLETSAFMMVCRGMESMEYAFLRCEKRFEFVLEMLSGGGRIRVVGEVGVLGAALGRVISLSSSWSVIWAWPSRPRSTALELALSVVEACSLLELGLAMPAILDHVRPRVQFEFGKSSSCSSCPTSQLSATWSSNLVLPSASLY